jgi:hypothetical protein
MGGQLRRHNRARCGRGGSRRLGREAQLIVDNDIGNTRLLHALDVERRCEEKFRAPERMTEPESPETPDEHPQADVFRPDLMLHRAFSLSCWRARPPAGLVVNILPAAG